MGNCIRQLVFRDNRGNQTSESSNSNDPDDLEFDSTDNGIVPRIRTESLRNVVEERRIPDSSHGGDRNSVSDNVEDRMSLEVSHDLSTDIRDSELSMDIQTSSDTHIHHERLVWPVERRIRRDSFGNEFTLPADPYAPASRHGIFVPPADSDIGSIASSSDIQQLDIQRNELDTHIDDDSASENDENADDLEISFVHDISDNDDKRVYFDGNSCDICVSEYDEYVHKPVVLPCGHVVCLKCVRKISKKKYFRVMECPMDRHTHSIKVRRTGKTRLQAQCNDVDHVTDTDDEVEFDVNDSLEIYRALNRNNRMIHSNLFPDEVGNDLMDNIFEIPIMRYRLNGSSENAEDFTGLNSLNSTPEHRSSMNEVLGIPSRHQQALAIRRNNGSPNLHQYTFEVMQHDRNEHTRLDHSDLFHRSNAQSARQNRNHRRRVVMVDSEARYF